MHISAARPHPTILGRKKLELRSAPPVPMLMYWAQKNVLTPVSGLPISSADHGNISTESQVLAEMKP
jgi:hypothetical protein